MSFFDHMLPTLLEGDNIFFQASFREREAFERGLCSRKQYILWPLYCLIICIPLTAGVRMACHIVSIFLTSDITQNIWYHILYGILEAHEF